MKEHRGKSTKRMLQMLRQFNQETAPHIKLRKRKLSVNPSHVEKCYRRCQKDEPALLIRHHAVQGLELWHCRNSNCNIIYRVERFNLIE